MAKIKFFLKTLDEIRKGDYKIGITQLFFLRVEKMIQYPEGRFGPTTFFVCRSPVGYDVTFYIKGCDTISDSKGVAVNTKDCIVISGKIKEIATYKFGVKLNYAKILRNKGKKE